MFLFQKDRLKSIFCNATAFVVSNLVFFFLIIQTIRTTTTRFDFPLNRKRSRDRHSSTSFGCSPRLNSQFERFFRSVNTDISLRASTHPTLSRILNELFCRW